MQLSVQKIPEAVMQLTSMMFVDPEILDALDEEQKQILFIKMREEQVKRWKAYEEKCEQEGEAQNNKSKDNSRRIRWLKGEDGEVWVWVMGEHKDDLTIEQITEKRALEEARQIAEKEMLESMRLMELNNGDVPVVGPHEDENTLKEQLSRIRPWNSPYSYNKIQESVYDDADSLFGSAHNGNIQLPSRATFAPELSRKSILKKSNESPLSDNGNQGDQLSNETSAEQPITEKTFGSNLYTDFPKSNGSDDKSQVLPSTSTSNTNFGESFADNSSRIFPGRVSSEVVDFPYGAYNSYSPLSSESSGPDFRPAFGFGKRDAMVDRSSPYGLKRFGTATNATKSALVKESSSPTGNPCSFPVSRVWNTQGIPPQKIDCGDNTVVKFRLGLGARSDLTDIDEEITKRQSEIFEKIKEKHQQFDREAEQEAERVEQAWEEQERKAREAEAQIRRIAQRAREQHRQQSLRTSSSILPFLKDKNASPLKDALSSIVSRKSLPRPPKPKSREAIINWFRTEELLRGTGLDPVTHRPAIWFHGIISRSRADQMLQNKPSGSFLVRVSERIWGYTISYVVGDGNIKHFLIERIPQGYQFLGTNQVVHSHLHELVAFHEVSPITSKGNEILRWAVGQVDIVMPDYADLIPSG
uniref:SH2 domain-containing protein n=1 Tax=Setaria digitata TaxID=48799 RepID=A0A915PHZ0_9BILA